MHDKRIMHPNKNRGNNSPPAGNSRLSRANKTAKPINDTDVMSVASRNGIIICTFLPSFKKGGQIRPPFY
tara:strand:+ start:443 stop:652 length:210 start_codon:yes stop_codon:yes gene_type:complete